MSVEAVAALREPVRRAVYEYAAGRGEPVGRDEVAEAVGIGRTLAAFHLDRLADAGLLEVSYARRSGRTGPGAGRPAKLYRRSVTELEVSVPPRRYRSAAGLLAEAVDRSGADELLFAAARRQGRSTGRSAGAAAGEAGLVEVLTEQGYEPRPRADVILLRNCPFHTLAREHPPLVCGMNLALLQGLVEGLDCPGATARMDPGTDHCCVVIDLASKNNDG
jgi:predicted ArsR family transcriptional regulator